MKKPHLRLHVRPGTHAGPWWWVELPGGSTTRWSDNPADVVRSAAHWLRAQARKAAP